MDHACQVVQLCTIASAADCCHERWYVIDKPDPPCSSELFRIGYQADQDHKQLQLRDFKGGVGPHVVHFLRDVDHCAFSLLMPLLGMPDQ